MHLTVAIFALTLFLPQTPDTTTPTNAHAEYTTIGHGVQIYKCTMKDNALQWVFQYPEADLYDTTTKQPVGTHFAGPTWAWKDKSTIVGKLLQSHPSPVAGSIPWLLLETHSTGESGALTNIKFVRRSDTQAGSPPPTGCDAQHQESTIRVPYEAIYTFYSAQ